MPLLDRFRLQIGGVLVNQESDVLRLSSVERPSEERDPVREVGFHRARAVWCSTSASHRAIRASLHPRRRRPRIHASRAFDASLLPRSPSDDEQSQWDAVARA